MGLSKAEVETSELRFAGVEAGLEAEMGSLRRMMERS